MHLAIACRYWAKVSVVDLLNFALHEIASVVEQLGIDCMWSHTMYVVCQSNIL